MVSPDFDFANKSLHHSAWSPGQLSIGEGLMGVLGLSENQELLLTRIVLTRAMLGECEGSKPPFLDTGETLWAWFGIASVEEVREYEAKLLLVLARQPRVQEALSRKDWYITWRGDKYYLTWNKGLAARCVARLSHALVVVAKSRRVLWLIAGIAMGAVVVYSILRPESLLMPRFLAFALSSCFYAVAAFLAGMFLFTKFVRSLDEAGPPWTRTQNLLLAVVVVVALAIGVSMGVWMAGEVRHDGNPWPEDVDQTYPY